MAKARYSWVKRATTSEKAMMAASIIAKNETAHELYDTTGLILSWSLARGGKAWMALAYIAQAHPNVEYCEIGQDFGGGSFVRCINCGDIRILEDGQIYFCLECDKDYLSR